MKLPVALVLFLTVLLGLSRGHRDAKPPRDVICNYIEDDRGYVCEITNLKLHSLDDNLRFTGKQIKPKSNEDVIYLHIHSSETHVVPSENIFEYFTNLQRLDMKKVSIKKLDEIVNCTPLEFITFSDNQITSLEAGVFIECVSLEVLDLSKNQISGIHDNAFSSLKELRELDLSFNQITKIIRKVIKPMKNLRKFSLKNNNIRELAHDTFNDMFHLADLDLSNNPLSRLDFRFFDYTVHIDTLRLVGTNIQKFHPFTFKNLRRLKFLDISENSLKHIDNDLLSTNGEIEELRMDRIVMKSIGRKFFDKLNKLTVFHANGNKCVDGIFRGSLVDIRPNFLLCMDKSDEIRDTSGKGSHSGEDL